MLSQMTPIVETEAHIKQAKHLNKKSQKLAMTSKDFFSMRNNNHLMKIKTLTSTGSNFYNTTFKNDFYGAGCGGTL